MSYFERLRRGAHDGRVRKYTADIHHQAAEYGITDPTVIEALYSRACHLATQGSTPVIEVYRNLLRQAAGPRPVAPCKRMRTEALYGNPNRWAAPKPGVGPGKRTRMMTLKEELAKRARYLQRSYGRDHTTTERHPGYSRFWTSAGTASHESRLRYDDGHREPNHSHSNWH